MFVTCGGPTFWLAGKLPNLELLWLNDNQAVGDAGCAQLLAPEALCGCPLLGELCLNSNKLSASVHKLAAALDAGALPRLTRLNLINNEIDDTGVVALARALGARAEAGRELKLKRLQLENNMWGVAGLTALVDVMLAGGLPALEQLDIHSNKKLHKDNDECKAAVAKAVEVAVQLGLKELKIGMLPPFDKAFKDALNLKSAAPFKDALNLKSAAV